MTKLTNGVSWKWQFVLEVCQLVKTTLGYVRVYRWQNEYCTHSTVRNGELTVYCCCESALKSTTKRWQAENYAVGEHFVKEPTYWTNFFDFIKQKMDVLCDRVQLALQLQCFTNSSRFAWCHLSAQTQHFGSLPLQTASCSKPTYWFYHEVWRLNEIRSAVWKQTWKWFKKRFKRGKDAILMC